ncbi:MAG: (2Fe-2S)-binding protein [Thermoproteota archaeon]|nr:MAG: (2Fe-2S)-binding protein [Candidatus Korarchaeota archaeon]
MGEHRVRFRLNGREVEASVRPNVTLLDLLRREFKVLSVRRGCETGECGMCTVLLDGKPVRSCLVLAVQVDGRDVTTVEGISEGGLHPVQEAFIEEGAVQCGYCTPAMVLTAKALLEEEPSPSEERVREALRGVLCRCTGYVKIVRAVLRAAGRSG